MTILVCAHATPQPRAFDAKELAEYRLTLPVFERFVDASDRIAAVTHGDQRFVEHPLFTREVSVLGDATVMARELETRLSNHSALAEALRAAGLSAREYTTFALTLFGARLAHGFMSSGVLHSIPKGVATDNVQFVAAHLSAVTKVLQVLGVEEPALNEEAAPSQLNKPTVFVRRHSRTHYPNLTERLLLPDEYVARVP